jgi:hypothetical protein
MRKLVICAIALSLVALISARADAIIVNFTINLDGLQEVPPNASPGSGFGTATLDTVTGAMSLSGTFAGLVSPTVDAHLHGLAPVGSNAGVIFGLTFTFGATSGTFSGNGILTPAQITGALNGETYVNIHTQAFPGGEIRGQVVPEPSSIALIGLVAPLVLRRRR